MLIVGDYMGPAPAGPLHQPQGTSMQKGLTAPMAAEARLTTKPLPDKILEVRALMPALRGFQVRSWHEAAP